MDPIEQQMNQVNSENPLVEDENKVNNFIDINLHVNDCDPELSDSKSDIRLLQTKKNWNQ